MKGMFKPCISQGYNKRKKAAEGELKKTPNFREILESYIRRLTTISKFCNSKAREFYYVTALYILVYIFRK